jgi:Prokaryotic E2 family A
MALNDGQRLALSQLEAIAAEGDAVELLRALEPDEPEAGLVVEITLRCAGFDRRPEGLPLRDRERFLALIPASFPFDPPSVNVAHKRWAGHPHVQWSSHLCLYVAPASEWNPSDGMFGLVDRLRYWLEKGALGELDPIGGPLHPPAAYARNRSLPMVVPRADTPTVSDAPWLGLADLRHVSDRRVDIVGWTDPLAKPWPERAAVAVLLPRPLTWEYPTKARDLLDEFERQRVDRRLLLSLLRLGAFTGGEGDPLFVAVGSPMRGVAGGERRQHLEVWYLHSDFVSGVRSSMARPSDSDELRELRADLEDALLRLADASPIDFCVVREDRPEVTERRDAGSPLEAFRGKSVAIWGCGALGAGSPTP